MHGVEEALAPRHLRQAIDRPLNKVVRAIRCAERLVVGLDGQKEEAQPVVQQAVERAKSRLVHADGEILEADCGLANQVETGAGDHVREPAIVRREARREARGLHHLGQQRRLGNQSIGGRQVVPDPVRCWPAARHGGGPGRIGSRYLRERLGEDQTLAQEGVDVGAGLALVPEVAEAVPAKRIDSDQDEV